MKQAVYRVKLKFKEGFSAEQYRTWKNEVQVAYDNRGGKAIDQSEQIDQCVFEGDEDIFGCFAVGMSNLIKNKDIMDKILSWDSFDYEEPEENESILELAIRKGMYRP